MTKNSILTPSLETIGEDIGQELGAKMVKDFQDANPNDVKSYLIGRKIIEQILNQPDCVAIQFYSGLDETGTKNLVYVGINSAGEIIQEFSTVSIDGKIDSQKGIVADRGTKDVFYWSKTK